MATVTDEAKIWAAKRAGNVDSVTAMGYLALGTGTTAEVSTQTTLVTEITDSGLARAAATVSYEATAKTVLTKTWTATATKAIREMAAFNASSGGTMWFRHLWATARNVDSGDSIQVTGKCTFS
jgi:hypothetical protein